MVFFSADFQFVVEPSYLLHHRMEYLMCVSFCVDPLISQEQKGRVKRKVRLNMHYENTPIQIYIKFHLRKLKIFR